MTFRIAGLLAWSAAALPLLRGALGSPSALSGRALVLDTAALLVFGAAFLAMTGAAPVRKRLGRSVTLLAAESLAALLHAFLSGSGIAGILLVIVAAQLPFCLARRSTIAWITVQNVLYGALTVARSGFVGGAPGVAAFLAFQLFALYTVSIAERETRQRKELARLHAELLSAQELLSEESRVAERLRISRDLHDALGHHLAALSLQLEVAGRVAEGRAVEPVEKARSVARLLLADVREVVGRFREDDRVNLGEALRLLSSDIPRPRIHLDLGGDELGTDLVVTATLLRSVQEIITNAVRHSGAENLWIALTRTQDGVEVHARDDGNGAEQLTDGHGLRGLSERIAEAHGSLEITTAPGQGFAVAIRIPGEPAGPA